jgi:hypothetical protein
VLVANLTRPVIDGVNVRVIGIRLAQNTQPSVVLCPKQW